MPYVGRELTRGSYIKLDDIQSQFNGSKTTFNLTSGGSAFYAGSATSVLVSIGGTVQEPVTEYGIDHNQIVFATAPTSSQNFFCVALGVALGVGVPARGSTGGNQLAKPLNYDDGLLYLDSVNDRVGIKTTSVGKVLDVYGGDARFNGGLVGNVYNSAGISTFNDLLINGDLTVQGDTTTLNTTLRNVELLRVSAASTFPAGIITQTGTGDILNLYDGTTEVFTVLDGGNVGIGSASPNAPLQINHGSPKIILEDNDNGADISIANVGGAAVYSSASDVAFQTSDTEEKVRIATTGKVGIGSYNPDAWLHIQTTSTTGDEDIIKFSRNQYEVGKIRRSAGAMRVSGEGNLHLEADYNANHVASDSNIIFNIDDDEKARITKDGRVGINTASPNATLHIMNADGANNRLELVHANDASSEQNQISFKNATTQYAYIVSGKDGSNNSIGLSFGTGTTERLRITSAGDLSLRSTTQNAHLGLTANSNAINFTLGSTAGASPRMYFYGTGNGETSAGDIFTGSGTGGNLHYRSGGFIKFEVNSDNSTTEALRIKSDGYIGIGVTNPVQKLSVFGNIYQRQGDLITWNNGDCDVGGISGYHLRFRTYDGSNNLERVRITGGSDAGRVGIGITNPITTVDIKVTDTTAFSNDGVGVGQNQLRINNAGASGVAGIRFDAEPSSGSAGYASIRTIAPASGSADLIFSTRNSSTFAEKVRIKSTGKVGIGTDNPAGNLEIDTVSSTTDMIMLDVAGVNFAKIGHNSASGVAVLDVRSEGHTRFLTGGNTERLRIKSDGELVVNHTQSSTPLNNTFLSIYDANSDSSAIDASGVSKNYAMISLHNYGTGIVGDTTGIGFGAASAFSYTKGSIAFARSGDYGRGDLVFLTNNDQSTAMVNDTDERMRITKGGNVNIGGNYTQTTYTMRVTGSFAATTKSFVIDHPTKENHKLRYACLEGPENSVYVRGRSSDPVIELPDYWVGLVHDDSITVNVTPIGNKNVWVESINNNSVTIGSDDSTEYFYTVFAERKDVEKLEVEVEN